MCIMKEKRNEKGANDMRQQEVSKWLKAITGILALLGLFFFIWVMPQLVREMAEGYESKEYFTYCGVLYGWGIAVCCYAMLWQFWKVCVQIGKDNSFSKENAKSFVIISRLSLVLAGIWFVGIVFLEIVVWLELGKLFFMVRAVLVCIILAILSAALSHLILKAYELKQENELTI